MDWMSRLRGNALEVVRLDFQKKGKDGLNMAEFVKAIIKGVCLSNEDEDEKILKISEPERRKLVSQLCELFEEVDRNGNGVVTWEEWTSYSVEAGLVATREIVEPLQYTFVEDIWFKDRHTKSAYVHRLKYFESIQRVLSLEAHSPIVKFYCPGGHTGTSSCKSIQNQRNQQSMNLTHTLDVTRVSSEDKVGNQSVTIPVKGTGKVEAINMLCIKSTFSRKERQSSSPIERTKTHINLLVVLSSDRSITFWDLSRFSTKEGIPLAKRLYARTLQTCVAWSHTRKALYTAGTEKRALINFYNITNYSKAGSIESRHTASITDLLVVDGDLYKELVSASLDRTIRIFDLRTHRPKVVLSGHKRGIRNIVHSYDHEFLLSAGIERTAYVWDLNAKTLLMRFKGHRHTIIGISTIQMDDSIAIGNKNNCAITLDAAGTFCVWNVDRVNSHSGLACCLLRFHRHDISKVPFSPRCFCVTSIPNLQIMAADAKICRFVSKKSSKIDDPPVCALFNSTSLTFITVVGNHVYVWEADTGHLLEIFFNIMPGEITYTCLDDRQRKFILGNGQGDVKIFNCMNGCLMKDAEYRHTAEITSLIYVQNDKTIISTSKDCTICIHDDLEELSLPYIRYVTNAHEKDISCAAYSDAFGTIVTGSTDGSINIWNYEFLRLEDSTCCEGNPEIMAIVFLKSFPIIAAACSDGSIFLFQILKGHHVGVITVLKNQYKVEHVKGFNNSDMESDQPEDAMETSSSTSCSRFNPVATLDIDHESNELQSRRIITKKQIPTFVEQPTNGPFLTTVTCLCVGEMEKRGTNLVLYAGDDKGVVNSWDITPIIKALKLKPQAESGFPRHYPGYNPRRRVLRNMKNQSQVNRKRSKCRYLEYKEIERTNGASIIDSWNVHEDSVRHIEYVMSPPSLITASYDCSARIHSLDGTLKGILNNTLSVPWTFDTTEPFQNREKCRNNFTNIILESFSRENMNTEDIQVSEKRGSIERNDVNLKTNLSPHPTSIRRSVSRASHLEQQHQRLRTQALDQLLKSEDHGMIPPRTKTDVEEGERNSNPTACLHSNASTPGIFNDYITRYQNLSKYVNRHRNQNTSYEVVKNTTAPSEFLQNELNLSSHGLPKRDRTNPNRSHQNKTILRKHKYPNLAPVKREVTKRPATSPCVTKSQSTGTHLNSRKHKDCIDSFAMDEIGIALPERPSTANTGVVNDSWKYRSRKTAVFFDQALAIEEKEAGKAMETLFFRNTMRSRYNFKKGTKNPSNQDKNFNPWPSKPGATLLHMNGCSSILTKRSPVNHIGPYSISEIKALYHLFLQFDTDASGTLDLKEFKLGQEGKVLTSQSTRRMIFESIDKKENESITFRAFLESAFPRACSSEIDQMIDVVLSQEGFINTAAEVEAGECISKHDVEEMFNFLDTDHNGRISLDEINRLVTNESFVTHEDVATYFNAYNRNESKELDINDFTRFYYEILASGKSRE